MLGFWQIPTEFLKFFHKKSIIDIWQSSYVSVIFYRIANLKIIFVRDFFFQQDCGMCVRNDKMRIQSNFLRVAIFQNFSRLLRVSPETNMSLFSLSYFILKANLRTRICKCFLASFVQKSFHDLEI